MEHQKEKRRHKRVPYQTPCNFTVLSMHGAKFLRTQSTGTIRDVSKDGIGITTGFPLQPGQVLQWDDKHKLHRLHIAVVKWTQRQDDLYRAGLQFFLR